MPTKTILSPAQRTAIFDPPADRATIERLYTLGPDDLAQVARRRRGVNRIGYAVQLCYLRHPRRGLLTGEAVPDAVLALLAEQIGCAADDFIGYAMRSTTLREHRAEIEALLGLRAFARMDVRAMLALGSEIATSTDRGEAIVAGMVDRLRADRIVLPAPSTLERLALIVRTRARKAAHANLIDDCSAEQEAALEHLVASDDHGRTRLGWIREWPEAPSAANLKGIVERLNSVRGIGIAADRARRIHAARYAVIARTAGIVTAQHLRRLERPRRLAMLVASMIEMEAALTDAALVMVEKMVGALFRRADRTRSDRLIGQARMLEDLTRAADDGLEEVVERYPAVRRFAPTFLAAFTFRTARSGDPLLGAIEVLRTMYRDGRSVLPKRVPTSFIKPRWRKVVHPAEGVIDRRAYEIAVIVHLRERLGSGSIWVDGSRACRTFDDYQLPVPVFEAMRATGDLRLAVPTDFAEWYEERRTLLARRMTEVERAAAAGELVDVTIERGQLLISPIRRSPSDDAEALKARLYAMLPRVRITDLLVEVAAWSGCADRFVHARSGAPASDQSALMGAILADATNLGLGRMAESSRGLTLPRLRWTAEWHVRDETYLSALAAIVDCHTAHPLAAVWGPGDTSSSDGQFFRAGGQGEARADRNARYGTEPGVLFYTHVTDRFTPFHTKVIAANAGEAAHVLDGLLDHESELVIREHATDTAGAVDHVFGLCHLLGFRFAPRIRDLNERRLYSLSPLDPWPTLRPLVAGSVNMRAIEENWDETLRLAASIRAGTVSAAVMLRKLAGFPRQNPVARALREIGRIERTLFMLDWFDDPDQRRRTGSILNKGEARNALARAIFFNRLGELRDRTFENQRHRASGLTLVTAAVTLWNTVYLDRAVRHLRGSGVDVPDELLAHDAPLGWEHVGLTGDYLWGEIDKPRERFRPLRLHQQSRDA
jgi:TnpA family transposase